MPGSKSLPAGEFSSQGVDVISIKHALLVADCLSFRRAAGVLGVEPSGISRRVKALEDRLGVSLFERLRTGVRVTVAGARFFEEIRGPFVAIDDAVKSAGVAGRGAAGRVSIGILSSMAGGFLRAVMELYRERHPQVDLDVREGTSVEHIALVRKRTLDVVFAVGSPIAADCDVEQLWTERIFAALPSTHALCAKDRIEWRQLWSEKLIVCQSEKGRALRDRVIGRLADFGHSLDIEPRSVTREILMHLAAMGLGVGLICEGAVATSFPGLVFRPMADDTDIVPFSAVWSPDNGNPAFRRFLSLARQLAKKKARAVRGAARVSSESTHEGANGRSATRQAEASGSGSGPGGAGDAPGNGAERSALSPRLARVRRRR